MYSGDKPHISRHIGGIWCILATTVVLVNSALIMRFTVRDPVCLLRPSGPGEPPEGGGGETAVFQSPQGQPVKGCVGERLKIGQNPHGTFCRLYPFIPTARSR